MIAISRYLSIGYLEHKFDFGAYERFNFWTVANVVFQLRLIVGKEKSISEKLMVLLFDIPFPSGYTEALCDDPRRLCTCLCASLSARLVHGLL